MNSIIARTFIQMKFLFNSSDLPRSLGLWYGCNLAKEPNPSHLRALLKIYAEGQGCLALYGCYLDSEEVFNSILIQFMIYLFLFKNFI